MLKALVNGICYVFYFIVMLILFLVVVHMLVSFVGFILLAIAATLTFIFF